MIKTIAKLIRLEQWYKNLIIFLPLLFAPNVLSIEKLVIGFFGFSCISAITYIFNDWMDREKDRLHPIKKERPLASGKISSKGAIIASIILSIFVIGAIAYIGKFYGIILISYFIITNLYSLGLKNIPILDILIIALNFAMRMMAGVDSFPDINTLPYFLLLVGIILIFLTHKRRSDIKLLGEKAEKHKPVLKFYTIKKNYTLRAIAYLIVITSLYLLWQSGLQINKLIGPYLLLMATSYIFSQNPEYTSKPQWLFKSKIWTSVLIGNIVLYLFF